MFNIKTTSRSWWWWEKARMISSEQLKKPCPKKRSSKIKKGKQGRGGGRFP